jgi:hypothetical protein
MHLAGSIGKEVEISLIPRQQHRSPLALRSVTGFGMRLWNSFWLSCSPDLHRLIVACRGHAGAIWRPGDGIDKLGREMLQERLGKNLIAKM